MVKVVKLDIRNFDINLLYLTKYRTTYIFVYIICWCLRSFDVNRTGTTTVCLGGRASLLYKVIFSDEEDQRALKDFLADASGGSLKSDQIKFSFTENPKHEVSHGLLVEEIGTTNLDLSKQSHTLILNYCLLE